MYLYLHLYYISIKKCHHQVVQFIRYAENSELISCDFFVLCILLCIFVFVLAFAFAFVFEFVLVFVLISATIKLSRNKIFEIPELRCCIFFFRTCTCI